MVKSFALILISVALLFACQRDEFAMKIFADKSLAGAEVVVDGASIGRLENNGSSDAYYSKWLSRQPHRVQVRKDSKIVYDETISIRPGESEYYVRVDRGSQ